MFKKKKEQIKERLLEEELVVTASDIASVLDNQNAPKEQPKPTDEVFEIKVETTDEVQIDKEEDAVIDEITAEEHVEEVVEELPQDVSWKDHVESIWDRVETEEKPKKLDPSSEINSPEENPEIAIKSHFIWFDADDKKALKIIEQKTKAAQKARKKNKGKSIPKEPTVETTTIVEENILAPEIDENAVEEKVDLNSFFEASKQKNKKLKRRDRKQYSKKELKRRAKRKKKGKGIEQLKDQNIYKFRRKKYKTIEDFISYLNDHYLDIDFVARDVLADELFLGWLSKKSGVFNKSLKEFKDIKEKIEKKS